MGASIGPYENFEAMRQLLALNLGVTLPRSVVERLRRLLEETQVGREVLDARRVPTVTDAQP
jgi:hypothetical protein